MLACVILYVPFWGILPQVIALDWSAWLPLLSLTVVGVNVSAAPPAGVAKQLIMSLRVSMVKNVFVMVFLFVCIPKNYVELSVRCVPKRKAPIQVSGTRAFLLNLEKGCNEENTIIRYYIYCQNRADPQYNTILWMRKSWLLNFQPMCWKADTRTQVAFK